MVSRSTVDVNFTQMLDALPDFISYYDTEYRYLWANKAVTEAIGVQLEELVGKVCYEVSRGYDAPCEFCSHKKALDSRNTIRRRTPALGGTIRDTLTIPIFEDEQIIGFFETSRDITDQVQIEKELTESEKNYKSLLDEFPDAITIKQAGNRVYANQRALDLYGFDDLKEFLKIDMMTITAEEDRARLAVRADSRIRGETLPFLYKIKILRKDGAKIPVEIHNSVISFNKKPALMNTIRDISSRTRHENRVNALYRLSHVLEEVETAEEAYSATFNTLHEILEGEIYNISRIEGDFLVDVHWTLTPMSIKITSPSVVTRAARTKKMQLIRDTREETEYLRVHEIELLSEVATPIISKEKVYGVINVESTLPNHFSEGDAELLQTLGFTVGNVLARLERVEALEKAVNDRTKELQESNERLLELDKMKNEFLSTAAHELRTPLTAIKGYMEIAQSIPIQENPVLGEYRQVIQRNIDRLEHVTNDLLDQQRLIAGKLVLHKEKVSIVELLKETILEIAPIFVDKKQEITLDLKEDIPHIWIDTVRVSQVFINILSNASKFSGNEAEIKVSVTHENNEVGITVMDSGVGIKQEDMEDLFNPFPRITLSSPKGGTGLGLSICKGIIDLHEGSIQIASEGKNMGTTVSVSLPL